MRKRGTSSVILLPAILILVAGFGQQTVRAQGTGEFLCSAGTRDGLACESDTDCPSGTCVITQGVCNGGDDDGFPCDCPGGSCSASPVCSDDATFGTCSGGTSDTLCCQVDFNCLGGPCQGTQKICFSGDFKSFPCLNNSHCDGALCCSTGKFCDGGDFDSYSCVDDADCPNGQCIGEAGNCGTPPPTTALTSTPTRTRTATVGGSITPSLTPTPPTPGAPTPTVTPTVLVTATASVTPTSVPTSQLAGNITVNATTFSVTDATTFPDQGTVLIDGEQLSYTGKFGNTLTGVQRGVHGTTATAHSNGATVTFLSASVPTPPPPTVTPRPREKIFVNIAEGGGCALRTGGAGGGTGPLVCLAAGVWWLYRRRDRSRRLCP